MTQQLKDKVRDILYSSFEDSELIVWTGNTRIRTNRSAKNEGTANGYDVAVFGLKLHKVEEVCEGDESIMEILDHIPKGIELALNSGVVPSTISESKSNGGYAYKYHLFSFKIEKIAALIGA